MTSEFLNRIFKLVGTDFHIDAFLFLDPACTILITAAFYYALIFSKDGPFHYFSLKYFNFPFFFFLMNIRVNNLVMFPPTKSNILSVIGITLRL